LEEVRERNNPARRDSGAPETTERTQDNMGHSQPKPKTFLDEAQAAHDALLKEVVALVRKQDTTTLLNIKELLQ